MHLVVCVKQVLDPEMSPRDFAIDPATKRPVAGKAPLVISTFDEIAVEVALQLKESTGGSSVSVLSLGPRTADEVLRKAMAMQADRAVRIEPGPVTGLDAVRTASALATAIRERLAPADVVLFGRQAGDTDGGLVGLLVAELLGWSAVTNAVALRPGPDGAVLVERETADGLEVVEARTPLAVTVTNAPSNVPRIPRVKDVMAAHRKPIEVIDLAALPMSGDTATPWTEVVDLFVPAHERACRMLEGDSLEARVDALVAAILDMKVL